MQLGSAVRVAVMVGEPLPCNVLPPAERAADGKSTVGTGRGAPHHKSYPLHVEICSSSLPLQWGILPAGSWGCLGQVGPSFSLEKALLHHRSPGEPGGGWELSNESCWAGSRSWGLPGLTLPEQNHFQTLRCTRKAQIVRRTGGAGEQKTGSYRLRL